MKHVKNLFNNGKNKSKKKRESIAWAMFANPRKETWQKSCLEEGAPWENKKIINALNHLRQEYIIVTT